MAKDNVKQVEMEITEGMEIIEETKSEGFGAKVMGAVKKHGKKIAVGAAALTALGIAFVLGKNASGEDKDDEEDIFEVNFEELEFTTDDAE